MKGGNIDGTTFLRKKGYLERDFRLFHLKDTKEQEFDYHYHDFDKIIIFLSGKVTYMVEGKSYILEPQDILLVSHHDIHKPAIDFAVPYERFIIYISPGFLNRFKSEDYDLSYCFQYAKDIGSSVFRVIPSGKDPVFGILARIDEAQGSNAFANALLIETLFLEFMIQLNRAVLNEQLDFSNTILYDKKIIEVVQYINTHLTTHLTVDILADHFFISKYHLMRKFKSETGYTLHNYVNRKRLLLARDMLKEDIPITKICYECGFQDYSAFLKAFKDLFSATPGQLKKTFSQ